MNQLWTLNIWWNTHIHTVFVDIKNLNINRVRHIVSCWLHNLTISIDCFQLFSNSNMWVARMRKIKWKILSLHSKMQFFYSKYQKHYQNTNEMWFLNNISNIFCEISRYSTKMKNRIFSRSIGIKGNLICFDWQQMIWKMFLFSFSPHFFRFVFSKRKKTQSTLEFHFTAIMHMIFNAEVLFIIIHFDRIIDWQVPCIRGKNKVNIIGSKKS